MSFRLSSALILLVVCVAPAVPAVPPPPGGSTFTVVNTNDSGNGSLRDAMDQANANPGTDTIIIQAAGTINLASQLPTMTDSVQISGPGSAALTVNGGGAQRVFVASSGNITLRGMTVSGGRAAGVAGGDSIASGAGGGALGAGGALFVDAAANVNVLDVAFSDNQASGGAGGNVTVVNININAGAPGGNFLGGGSAQGGLPSSDGEGGAFGGGGGGGGSELTPSGGPIGSGGAGGTGGFGAGGGGGGNQDVNAPGPGGAGGEANAGGAGGRGATVDRGGGGGGGGAGLGGAVFVRTGGTLTLSDFGLASTNTATGGPGGTGGNAGGTGNSEGNALYLMQGVTAALDVSAGRTSTVAASVGGAGGLAKTGAGTLELSTANTYAGGTTVNAGTLAIRADANLGAAAGGVTLDGGTLEVTGAGFQTSRAITVGGAGGAIDVGGGAVFQIDSGITGAGALAKAGAGTMTLSGASTYAGMTTIDEGLLVVNGSLAGPVTVGTGGQLGGRGTVGGVVNSGRLTPGNSIDTLNVAGSFTQTAGGTLVTEVNAAGQSDRVRVVAGNGQTGSATLAGAVLVDPAAGSYAVRTSYTILTAAGGLSGTQFTSVSSTNASLSPSLSYLPDSVVLDLFLVSSSFGATGLTSNQRAVGRALDTLVAARGVPLTLEPVVNQLLAASNPGLSLALESLSGVETAGANAAAIDASEQIQRMVVNQLGTQRRRNARMRAGSAGSPSAAGPAARFASSDALLASPALPGQAAGTSDEVWAMGFGQAGRIDAAAAGARQVDSNGGGFALGRSWRRNDHWTVGAHAGFSETNVSFDGTPNSNDVRGYQFGADASWQDGRRHVDATVDFTRNSYDSRRFIAAGSVLGTALGDYDGNQLSAYALAGIDCPQKHFMLEPQASLQARRFEQNDFGETGAAGASLNVRGQEIDSLQAGLGLRAYRELALDRGRTVVPDLTARWVHELGDVDRLVSAAFISTPTFFSVSGQQADRDRLQLRAGVTARTSDQLTLDLSYNLDSGDSHRQQAGLLRAVYRW